MSTLQVSSGCSCGSNAKGSKTTQAASSETVRTDCDKWESIGCKVARHNCQLFRCSPSPFVLLRARFCSFQLKLRKGVFRDRPGTTNRTCTHWEYRRLVKEGQDNAA